MAIHSVAVLVSCVLSIAVAAEPCCQTCPSGKEKYYSIPNPKEANPQCGECCLQPSRLKFWKIFEPKLLKGDCASNGYTQYVSTETDGVWPASVTNDRYARPTDLKKLRDYANYTFVDYLAEFGKTYQHPSTGREAIFIANLAKVVAHNEEYKNGQHTWWAEVNHLTDATEEEFRALRSTKYSPSEHPIVELEATGPNPTSVDWRNKSVVTPVKNQLGCGSCWAFSATESVESAYAIATGKLLILAPQTYVNCVKNPDGCGGTGGCEGATMELAFNLTAQTGIALESDLPYAGVDQACKAYKAAVKISGHVKNPVNNAKALETAVATKGPQSVTVAAGLWGMYGGGVFSGCSSSGTVSDNELDHGVQLVGYTEDAWIVRNSWTAGWGEKGYIRIARASDAKTFLTGCGGACKPYPKSQTVGGECGILYDTSYLIGVSVGLDEIVV